MKKTIFSAFLFFLLGGIPLSAQLDRQNLQVRVDPAFFSPNKDALQDQLFLYPVLKSSEEISRWRMDIRKKGRGKIARLSGPGFPALIKWDGLDKKGAGVADGPYVARLTVTGRSHEFAAEQEFSVDTKPPLVGLALSTAVVDKTFLGTSSLRVTPTATDDSPLARWLVQVVDAGGRTVQVFWSTGPIRDIAWDGTDQSTKVLVPQGIYRCVFQAWDMAGNQSEPVFADITVNVTAREMLEQALHRIRVNETALGLVVQLRNEDIFGFRRNEIYLTEEGQETLREVAILVNAYTDAPVKLDGYSKRGGAAAKDRDQASLYAWRIYSFLIKTGNVKPSRVTVRGRGRSAMFDRRAVSIPVLRDGVEVILEGNRQW